MNALFWFVIFSIPSQLLLAAGVPIELIIAGVTIVAGVLLTLLSIGIPATRPVYIIINIGGIPHALG